MVVGFFGSKTFNPQIFGKYIDTILNTVYFIIPISEVLRGTHVNYDGKTIIVLDTLDTYYKGAIITGRSSAWKEMDFAYDVTERIDFLEKV